MRSHYLALVAVAAGGSAAAAPPAFDADVRPVFEAKCVRCHGADDPKGGLDVRTVAALEKGGKSGPVFAPGTLRGNALWTKVNMDLMPPGKDKLTPAERDTLRAWILQRRDAPAAAAPPKGARPAADVAADIDRLVDARLAAEKVTASPTADDATFLRRATLDLTGEVPTAEAAAAILADKAPDKRAKLIDALLASPKFGQHLATTWNNRLVPLSDKNQRVYDTVFVGWLAAAANANRPWNEVVADLLTAETAADKARPPVTLFRVNPEPKLVATAAARQFLGVRLECAECHNHPTAAWQQREFWGLAAFFARVRSDKNKVTEGPATPPKLKPGEKPPPEPPAGAAVRIPDDAYANPGAVVRAKFLGGPEPDLPADGPYRPALARWLTAADNPYFARAAANRLWAHVFGRGIVHPADDFDASNPPSHPEVLDLLAREFAASGFDQKHLLRCLCATRAYHRSGRPAAGHEAADDRLLARMRPKLLTPEQLYASLGVVLGPQPLTELGGKREAFASFFAAPDGDDDGYNHGIAQVMRLLNADVLHRGAGAVEKAAKKGADPAAAVDALFLAALARHPTADERKRMTAFVAGRPEPKAGYAGVLWALLNSAEFVINR
ncbi:MAG: hypothetical protein C0501_28035 [Isosphaera sp.]|nr:hypothetical protein [Isosphaera sp.]